MSRQLSSIISSGVRRSILAALAGAYVLLLVPPWQFGMPGRGLDSSWVEVIGHGARHGWQWGRDLVFTYGPLGFLLPNPYEGGSIVLPLAANTFLGLALALGLIAILPRDAPRWSIGLFLLMAFPAAMLGRWACAMLGLLAALVHFERPAAPLRWPAVILAAAAGVYSMVYLSSGVSGLGILALVDLSRLAHRRWPVFVPVFAGAALSAYLVAGQDVTHLPRFLRGALELISGYAGAMSVVGNRLELAAFPALSALVLACIVWSERARLRRRDDRVDALLLVAAVGLNWFVAFKSGFMRHDLHSVAAWLTLAATAAGFAAIRWRDPSARGVRWLLIGLSIAVSSISVFALEQQVLMASLGRQANRVLIRQPLLALEEATQVAVDFGGWKHALLERRMQALAAIRAEVPLPSVPGTVDVIANEQSAVLAHGLQYRPRPVFQDYAAYTPWLIEVNRAHYRSGEAAEYVLFTPAAIDNRYPLLEQSTTINELLTRYDPLRLEKDQLVLKRRAEPLRSVATDPTESMATLGQWVSIEAVDAPVMVSAVLSPNLMGRLAALLFRQPILALTVRLADGSEHQFRLIEGMARSGFLLSPLVESALDFAATATGAWKAMEDQRVVAFRIDTFTESGRRFYGPTVKYASQVLRLDADRARTHTAELLSVAFRRQRVARTMAHLSSQKPPVVAARETELFAHAPARLALPVQSASRVRATFAIQPGAWSKGGGTDGVCFRIFELSGGGIRRTLFDRCLDPLARAEDQPEQTAEAAVGLRTPGTLVFETTCRAFCNWDWSYWKDIDIEP